VAEYKQAFKRFDADGSGSISTKEVSTALADLDLLKGRSEEEVRRMVAAVDVDGSGEVDFAEFLEMMRHSAGALSALVREEKALHEAALQVRVAGGRG
jgi:Ca2+-binding EF-hand superfamily protein